MKLEKGSNARVSACLPRASRQCQCILTSISRKILSVAFLAGWASVGSWYFRCSLSWFSLVRRKERTLSQSSHRCWMTAAVIRKLSAGVEYRDSRRERLWGLTDKSGVFAGHCIALRTWNSCFTEALFPDALFLSRPSASMAAVNVTNLA